MPVSARLRCCRARWRKRLPRCLGEYLPSASPSAFGLAWARCQQSQSGGAEWIATLTETTGGFVVDYQVSADFICFYTTALLPAIQKLAEFSSHLVQILDALLDRGHF